MRNYKTDIPDGWLACTLGAVVDYGGAEKREPAEIPGDAWVLELEDIEKDTSRIITRSTFAERDSRSTKNRFRAGDVLYGKLRPYLNKVVRADRDGFCTTEIVPIRPPSGIEGGYLFYWLKHPVFLDYVAAVSHGLNMPRLGTEAGKAAPFILAPTHEQGRIVDKLDAIFERTRATRERLERVPALLDKLKRSILAAAFRGDLSKDWRAAHPNIEPASVLLERIRAERRHRWEESIRAKGKDPKKAKYEEPAAVDTTDLPELPEGWAWTSLGMVAPLQAGYAFPSKSFCEVGVRLLKGVNVRDGWLSVEEVDHWNPADCAKYAEFRLSTGDVVLAMDRPVYSSGSRATKVARLNAGWNDALLLQRVGRFRALALLDLGFLHLFVSGPFFRNHLIQEQNGSQDGKDLPHVSAAVVDACPIPVPPFGEQKEILRQADAALSRVVSLHESVRRAFDHTTALEKCSLEAAFRGELVSQDAGDEPADQLLARIMADKSGMRARPKAATVRRAVAEEAR